MLEQDYRIYTLRNSNFWGPVFWDYLYLKILGLPVTLSPQQSSELQRFFKYFYNFLPCIDCRYHYYKMIKEKNIDIESRQEAFNFVLSIHNEIRQRQSKQILTEKEVIDYFYRKRLLWDTFPYMIALSILCVITALFIYCNKSRLR